MPSITVSVDYATLLYIEAYKSADSLDNVSQAVRKLVKKGIAHEEKIRNENGEPSLFS